MPVINPGEYKSNAVTQNLDVQLANRFLGSGNRLGKKPKASPFAAPGHSLRQVTTDGENNADSNHAPTSEAATDSLVSNPYANHTPKIQPETPTSSASNFDTPNPKSEPAKATDGIRIHKIKNPISKAPEVISQSQITAATSSTIATQAVPQVPGREESAKLTILRADAAISTPTPALQPFNREEIAPVTNIQVTTADLVPPILPQGWRAWPQDGIFFF